MKDDLRNEICTDVCQNGVGGQSPISAYCEMHNEAGEQSPVSACQSELQNADVFSCTRAKACDSASGAHNECVTDGADSPHGANDTGGAQERDRRLREPNDEGKERKRMQSSQNKIENEGANSARITEQTDKNEVENKVRNEMESESENKIDKKVETMSEKNRTNENMTHDELNLTSSKASKKALRAEKRAAKAAARAEIAENRAASKAAKAEAKALKAESAKATAGTSAKVAGKAAKAGAKAVGKVSFMKIAGVALLAVCLITGVTVGAVTLADKANSSNNVVQAEVPANQAAMDAWKAAVDAKSGTVKLTADWGITATETGTTDKYCNYGALLVPSGVSITLDLNGYTLSRNNPAAQSTYNSIISITGTLTIIDSSTSKNGKITGATNSRDGAIVIQQGATLNFYGGTVTGNTSYQGPGGICAYGANARLNMTAGAVVSSNISTHSGDAGGISFIGSGVYCNITGGVITGNTGTYAGGIYLSSSTRIVSLSNVTVSGNTATANDLSAGGIKLYRTTYAVGDGTKFYNLTIKDNKVTGTYTDSTNDGNVSKMVAGGMLFYENNSSGASANPIYEMINCTVTGNKVLAAHYSSVGGIGICSITTGGYDVATFRISGGEISNNSGRVGGVLSFGKLTITDSSSDGTEQGRTQIFGNIASATAISGSDNLGVSAVWTMKNGSYGGYTILARCDIFENTVDDGVIADTVRANGASFLRINGCSIVGNTVNAQTNETTNKGGAAVHMVDTSTLELLCCTVGTSNNPNKLTIYDNLDSLGNQANVWLNSGLPVNVTAPITADSKIGISRPGSGQITFGYGRWNGDRNPLTNFYPNGDGLVKFAKNQLISGTFTDSADSASHTELSSKSFDYAVEWQEAVDESKNNGGKEVVFALSHGDWVGASLATTYQECFASYNNSYFYYGGLNVPSGAKIRIDLMGNKLDRNLQAVYTYGTVIFVAAGGTLIICDSSDGQDGMITGGNMVNKALAAITVYGDCTLESGHISGNYNGFWNDTSNIGGIAVWVGTDHGHFYMTGGVIDNNTGERSASGRAAVISVYSNKIYNLTTTHIEITGGTICNNTAKHLLYFYSCEPSTVSGALFKDNYTYADALYIINKASNFAGSTRIDVNLNNITMDNNTVGSGNLIYWPTFNDNTSNGTGAEWVIENITLTNNKINSATGTLFVAAVNRDNGFCDGHFRLKGWTIKNNKVGYSAVSFGYSRAGYKIITIDDCLFEANYPASGAVGPTCINYTNNNHYSTAKFTIENNTRFIDNLTTNGALLSFTDGVAGITIKDSTISGTRCVSGTATQGSYLVDSAYPMSISDCTITDNQAYRIINCSSNLSISDTEVTDNVVRSGGGVIVSSTTAANIFELDGCTVTGNTANGSSGVVQMFCISTIKNTVIRNNHNEQNYLNVQVENSCSQLNIGGYVYIYANTYGSANTIGDLRILSNTFKITIDEALGTLADTKIGIYRDGQGAITQGYGLYHSSTYPWENYFFNECPNVATSTVGEGNTYEPALISLEPANQWEFAIASSLADNGNTYTAHMYRDWIVSGSFSTSRNNYYSDGGLYVPKGASVILELDGHTVSRGLTASVVYGQVIAVEKGGELIIRDSSTAQTGKITGGNNRSTDSAAGIKGGGTVRLESGSIEGNQAPYYSSSYRGGIGGVGLTGTFIMTGGAVKNNVGSANASSTWGTGGIAVTGHVEITGGEISGNSGRYGALCVVADTGDNVIKNVVIKNNTSTGKHNIALNLKTGYVAGTNADFTIEGGEIAYNTTTGHYFMTMDGNCVIKGVNINHNSTANTDFIAYTYTASYPNAELLMDNCTISSNSAKDLVTLAKTAVIKNCTFSENTAKLVVYFYSNNSSAYDWSTPGQLNDCVFDRNSLVPISTSERAGVICCNNATVTAYNVEVKNTTTSNLEYTAGVLWTGDNVNDWSCDFTGTELDIHDNQIPVMLVGAVNGATAHGVTTIVDSEIYNNTADAASATGPQSTIICVYKAGEILNLKNVQIYDNYAGGIGAVFVEANTTLNMENVTIVGNDVKGAGALRYHTSGSNLAAGSLKGSIIVSDNTNSAVNETRNLYMPDENIILEVTGALTGSSVGVYRPVSGVFTHGYGQYNTVDPTRYFTSDDVAVSKVVQLGTGTNAEAATFTNDPLSNWVYAVTASLADGGKPYVCEMTADMVPKSGTSFGTVANCYHQGRLYVPQGAHVILEMNGHNVDRKLTSAIAYGGIFFVEGRLDIVDNVGGSRITGGYSKTTGWDGAAGITINSGGIVNILEGTDASGEKHGVALTGLKGGAQHVVVAVSNNNGTFTMTNGEISNNVNAPAGYIISVAAGTTTTLTGMTFSANTGSGNNAIIGGSGDLNATDCTFTGCGGSVYFFSIEFGAVATFTGCTFEKLRAADKIFRVYGSELVLDDCIISDCRFLSSTETTTGCLIWGNISTYTGVTLIPVITIKNSTIVNNMASGLIMVYNEASTLNLEDTVLDGNIGTSTSGGSDFCYIGGTATIKGCVIKNQGTSSSNKMLTCIKNAGNLKLEDVTFENNIAINSIISLAHTATFAFSATDCKFINNTSRFGTVRFANVLSFETTITFNGCDISGNTVTYSNCAGAFTTSDAWATIKIDGCTIDRNTGTAAGGLFVNSGKIVITNSEVTNNTATSAVSAGGINIAANGDLGLNYTKIAGNTGVQAGGIYLPANKNLTMNAGEISGNTATSTTGAGGVYTLATFRMSGGEIKNNTGTLAGGIYLPAGSKLQVAGQAVVQGNTNTAGDKSNVYFANDDMTIDVVGQLTAGASIGVYRTAITLVTSNYGAFHSISGIEPVNFFTADAPKTAIATYGSGQDMEAIIFSFNNELNWSYAVSSSLAEDGAQKTFTMYEDWTAKSDRTSGTSFGSLVGYLNGALYVPVGADVVLDLKNFQLDRALATARANGHVIYVAGKLTIKSDSLPADIQLPAGMSASTLSEGIITGGNTSTANSAGGIVVAPGGSVVFERGILIENKATGAGSAGGVYISADETADNTTDFEFKGGQILGNVGTMAGGIYAANGTLAISGGTITANSSTATTGIGGVYVGRNTELQLKGKVNVNSNTNYAGVASNIYLANEESKITVTGSIDDSSRIYLSRTTVGPFTTGFGEYNTNSNDTVKQAKNVFKTDNDIYYVKNVEVDGHEEGFIGCSDNAINWVYAVSTSLANGGQQQIFEMNEDADWVAKANSSYTTAFGENTGFSSGRLYVPAGANVVLDLKGRKINRNLADRVGGVENGSVIYVAGTLTIIDSVGGGEITGGFSLGAGGIYVNAGGTLNFEGGSVTGNMSSGAENAAGINVAGVLNLKGGTVTGNTGNGFGGILVEDKGKMSLGGEKQFPEYTQVPEVYGNTKAGDKASNISLTGDTATIDVLSPITVSDPNKKFGVTRDGLGPFTNGLGQVMPSAVATDIFTADDKDGKYYIGQTGTGDQLEAVMCTDDNAINWSYAVKMSLAQNGAQWKVTLTENWTAEGDTIYYTRSFGPDTKPGFLYGALYVPEGANIILDLKGFKVDRDLENARTNGEVFLIGGKFTLMDSSETKSGVVTGGNNSTNMGAGGVVMTGSSEFYMTGGTIRDNKATANSSIGGVSVRKFVMTGGKIINNTGAVGGVYIDANAEMSIGGQSDIYGNTKADGSASNVYFQSAKGAFTIVSDANNTPLTPSQTIGVTRSAIGPFTKGYGPVNGDDRGSNSILPSDCFHSENPKYEVDGDYSDGFYECFMTTEDNALNWDYAVLTSLANDGKQMTFTMHGDWNAEKNSSFTTAFGTAANCYINGALYVPVGASVVLDLNGATLNRALSAFRDKGFVIRVDGELLITDRTDAKLGKITGGKSNTTNAAGVGAGALVVGPTGKVKFESGSIKGNRGTVSGGVSVMSGGEFTLAGGYISENEGTNSGAVYVYNQGKFVMNSGYIEGNVCKPGGAVYTLGEFVMEKAVGSSSIGMIVNNNGLAGGVYVGNTGTFILRQGIITENSGTSTGGVYVANSTRAKFQMEGGSIIDNTGISAGGVYAAGIMDMTGGVIEGNQATGSSKSTGGGSGVYVPGTGTFTMTGGEIKGNTGMNGVRGYSSAVINLGGAAKIYDNFVDGQNKQCNVYLSIPSRKINIISEFDKDVAHIGVTRDSAGVFTNGYGDFSGNGSVLPQMVFFSDDTRYAVSITYIDTEDGERMEAAIGMPVAMPTKVDGLAYTGQSQVIVNGYNADYMTCQLANGTTLNGSEVRAVNVGAYTIKFVLKDGFCWDNGSNEPLSLYVEISPIVVTLIWEGDVYVFDGQKHVPTATVTNLVPGDVCKVTVSGEAINVGEYTASAILLSNSNYALYEKTPYDDTDDNTDTDDDDSTSEPEVVSLYPTHPFEIIRAAVNITISTVESEFGKELQLKVNGNIGKGAVHYYLIDEYDEETEIEDGIFHPTAQDVINGSVTVIARVDATNNTYAGESPKTTIAVNKGVAPIELVTDSFIYGDTLELTVKDYDNSEGQYPVFEIDEDYTDFVIFLDDDHTIIRALKAGTIKIWVSVEENNYFKETRIAITVTVEKKPVTIIWSDKTEFTYDCFVHVPTATLDPNCIVGDDEVNVMAGGGQIAAGEYTANLGILLGKDADNYTTEGAINPTCPFVINRNKVKLEIIKDAGIDFNEYVGAVFGIEKEIKVIITSNVRGQKNVDVTSMIDPQYLHFRIAEFDINNLANINEVPESAFTDIQGNILNPPAAGYFVIRAYMEETENFEESKKDGNWAAALLKVEKGTPDFKLPTENGDLTDGNDGKYLSYKYGVLTPFNVEGLDPMAVVNYRVETYNNPAFPNRAKGVAITQGDKILPSKIGWVKIIVELAESQNYNCPATFSFDAEIVPLPIEITWSDDEIFYDGTPQMPAYTRNGFSTDDVKLKIRAINAYNSIVEPINAGDYTALVYGLTGRDAENYTLVGVDGATLTCDYIIRQRVLMVAWGKTELEYTGELQAPNVTLHTIVPNDVCIANISGKEIYPNANPNEPYTATIESISNSNYVLDPNAVLSTTFRIKKAVIDAQLKETQLPLGTLLKLEAVCTNGDNEVVTNYGTATFALKDPSTTKVTMSSDYVLTPHSQGAVRIIVTINGNQCVEGGDFECIVTVVKGAAPIKLINDYAYYGEEYPILIQKLQDPESGETIIISEIRIENGTGAAGTLVGRVFIPEHAGTVTLYIKTNTTNCYDGTMEIALELTIVPRRISLEWIGDAFDYDGNSHCPIAVVDNLIGYDTCTVAVSGAQINAGSYQAEAVGLGNANYCLIDNTRDYDISTSSALAMAPTNNTDYLKHDFVINKIELENKAVILNESTKYGVPVEIEYKGLIDIDYILYTVIQGTGDAEIIGGVLTPLQAGTITISAYIVEKNYNPYTITKDIIIYRNDEAFELKNRETVYGTPLKLELTGCDVNRTVTYTIAEGGTGEAELQGDVLIPIHVGTVFVDITVGESNDFAGGTIREIVTITPFQLVLKWTMPTGPYTYNGTVQRPIVEAINVYPDDVCDLVVDATKNAGKNVATVTGVTNDNYTIEGLENLTADYEILPFLAQIEWEEHIIDGNVRHYYFTSKEIAPKAIVTNLFPGDVCEVIVRGGQIDVSDEPYDAVAFELSNSNYTLDGAEGLETTFMIIITSINPELTTTTAEYGKELQLEISGNIGKGEETYYLTDENGEDKVVIPGGKFVAIPEDVARGYVYVLVEVAGTDNTYPGKTKVTKVTVEKGTLDIGISISQAVYGTDTPFTVTGNSINHNVTLTIKNDTDTATMTHNGELVAYSTEFTLTPTKVGTVIVNIVIAETDLYKAVDVDVEVTIVPRTVELTWTYPELIYNGEEQVPTATVGNIVTGDTCNIIVSGKINAGTDLTATATEIQNADGSVNENYTLEGGIDITTTYVIKPRPVTVVWSTNTALTFTGETQAPEFTIVGLVQIAQEDGTLVDEDCKAVVTGKQTNVGTDYVASVTGFDNSNYVLADGADGTDNKVVFSIEIADVEIVITTVSGIMGQELTLEVEGNIGNGVVTYQIVEGGTANATILGDKLLATTVGTVNVIAYVAATSNTYAGQSEVTEITIEKATAPIVIENTSIEYGTREKLVVLNNNEFGALTYRVYDWNDGYYYNGHRHYGRATIDADGYITGKDVGGICVAVTVEETTNYKKTTIVKHIDIRPRKVEIGWSNLEVTYNGKNQLPTVTILNCVNGDDPRVYIPGNGYIDAGIYEVAAKLYYNYGNRYTLDGVNNTNKFTIGRATLDKITLKEKSTAIDKDLKLELLNNYGRGEVTYTIANDTGAAVLNGSDILHPTMIGKVRVTIDVAESQNYNSRTIEEVVDIGKRFAPLAVTSEKVTTYGQTLPITVTGVPSSAVLIFDVRPDTGNGTISGSSFIATHAGKAILLVTTSGTADYQATTLEVEIEIKPIVVELDWDEITEFQYDGEVHNPNATVKEEYLINDDTCEVVVIGGQINAGTHTATAGALTNSNYTVVGSESATCEYTIFREPLEIEIVNTTAVYGTEVKLQVSGNLGNGEVTWTISNSSGSATLKNGNILVPTNVGTVILTANVAASQNYSSATATTVLTILKMPVNIEFTSADLSYGTSYNILDYLTGVVEDADVTLSIQSGTGDAAINGTTLTPTRVGTVTVTATIGSTSLYDGDVVSATFAIRQKVVTLDWIIGEYTYDKTEHKPTAVVTNLYGDDVCEVEVRGSVGANKTATAEAISLSNTNYTLEGAEVSTTFEIKPAVANLTWYYDELTYNGSEQKPRAEVNNLYPDDECTVLVLGQKDAGTNLEAKAIHLTNDNYTLEGCTNVTTKFDIKARPAQIEWVNLALIYNGESQTPEIILTNLVEGDKLNPTITGGQIYVNKVTGTTYYVATVIDLGNYNYVLPEDGANCTAQFTINPLEVEFEWDSLTLKYSGQVQLPSYTITNLKNDDDVAFTFVGGGKDVNQYTIAISLVGADSDNYTIKSADIGARYEIVAQEITITIQSQDVFVVYTGNPVVTLNNWYTLTADGFVGEDVGKKVDEVFDVSSLRVDPRFTTLEGIPTTPIENGDYKIVPYLLSGAVRGNENYTVSGGIMISTDYGTLTIGAPRALQLAEGTNAQFIFEEEVEEWGELMYYRRTYAEKGMVHGIDDVDFERIVIGQIKSETTINAFLETTINASQLNMIRLYDNRGSLMYDCGHAANGIDEADFNDSEMYRIGTGWYIELVSGELVTETVYLSVMGDTNGDGFIAPNDSVRILSCIGGTIELDSLGDEYRLAMYVNNVGFVAEKDAVSILSIYNCLTDEETYFQSVE